MQPILTDQELVMKAQNGDEEALSMLYETYIDSIFAYLSYRVNSTAIAEDLTSEVFLRMVRNLHKYQDWGLPFRAWLFRIAANLLTDHYRSGGKYSFSEVNENYESDDTDPFDRIVKEDEKLLLRLAIQRLPEDYQNLLIFRFVEDLPHTEIAKIMNKSAIALRSMQYRALKALEEQLSQLNEKHSAFRGTTHDE
jgi:RNA polymerase sigma-70 factor (ECF subfamily)